MSRNFLVPGESDSGRVLLDRKANENDPFELLGADKSILVRVQVLEGLADSFALKTFHQLGKLVVCDRGIRQRMI
jgi:hypothetical protein